MPSRFQKALIANTAALALGCRDQDGFSHYSPTEYPTATIGQMAEWNGVPHPLGYLNEPVAICFGDPFHQAYQFEVLESLDFTVKGPFDREDVKDFTYHAIVPELHERKEYKTQGVDISIDMEKWITRFTPRGLGIRDMITDNSATLKAGHTLYIQASILLRREGMDDVYVTTSPAPIRQKHDYNELKRLGRFKPEK